MSLISQCPECGSSHLHPDGGRCTSCRRGAAGKGSVSPEAIPDMSKSERTPVQNGLSYMEKPHRYTPGPAGHCLFCANTQRWHTENRPQTPAEVEEAKRTKQTQDKAEGAAARALHLTALPTPEDMLAQVEGKMKTEQRAGKIAGTPANDPDDPATAAGVTDPKAKAALKKALTLALTERLRKAGDAAPAPKPDMDPAAGMNPDPSGLLNLQYDPNSKAGGISQVERKDLSDNGIAMEDGTFPIRDEADLKSALSLWGEASDPYAVRDHLIARAYDLDLMDMLPDNLKAYGEKSQSQGGDDKEDDNSSEDENDPTDAAEDAKEGEEDPAEAAMNPVKKSAYVVTKASTDEEKYTFGPVYIPDRLDAHNEFTTADELQKAIWGYVRAGDRDIRLQHNTSVKAGECVEVATWPQAVTMPLALPSGNLSKSSSPTTFPAGTAWMGIKWEPWAWELVKKGAISGLSMGGSARRITVDLGPEGQVVGEEIGKAVSSNPTSPSAAQVRPISSDYWLVSKRGDHWRSQIRDPKTGKWSPGARAGISTGVTTPFHFLSTNDRTGVTEIEHHPENSSTPEIGGVHEEMSGAALAVTRLLDGMGISLDSFLSSLRKSVDVDSLLKSEHWLNELRDTHGRWSTGESDLDKHLVDYYPTRPLSSSAAEPITKTIPNARHIPYTQSPFFKALPHLGIPTPTSHTSPAEHEAARNKLFNAIPHTTPVRISSLTFTQSKVNKEALHRAVERGGRRGMDRAGGIFVVKSGGKHYLIDGHHGTVGAAAKGETHVHAKVLNLDAVTKSQNWLQELRDRDGEWTKGGGAGDLLDHMAGTHQVAGKVGEADYASHVTQIQRTITAAAEQGDSPSPLFSKTSTHISEATGRGSSGHPIYTPARQALHREIINAALADAAARGVPKEHRSWIAGGLPGAGKTSFLKSEKGKSLGLDVKNGQINNAITLNPDDMKVSLLAKDGAPKIPGLDPLEKVAFLHEESSYLADQLAQAAYKQGYNVVWDITAHSPESVASRMHDLQAAGYPNSKMTYFLLDVPIKHSVDSATARHRNGYTRRVTGKSGDGLEEQASMGGRYVPADVIKSNAYKGKGNYLSNMSSAFDAVTRGAVTKKGETVGYPGRMVHIDNSGYQGKITADFAPDGTPATMRGMQEPKK